MKEQQKGHAVPVQSPRSCRLAVVYSDNKKAVYVKDDAYAWLPARVVETDEENNQVTVSVNLPTNWHKATVLSRDSTIIDLEDHLLDALSAGAAIRSSISDPASLRTVHLDDYTKSELPLQNLQRGTKTFTLDGKRDMADLPYLHEAAILYNLKERHFNLQPYTRVGDIVIAVNPFTWIDGLYTDACRNIYAKSLIWTDDTWTANDDADADADADGDDDDNGITNTNNKNGTSKTTNTNKNTSASESSEHDLTHNIYDQLGYDPHVYETSSLAYKGLAISNINQTILVSGESGAGKTETVKILMESLATIERTRPNYCTTHSEVPVSGDASVGSRTLSGAEMVRRVLKSNPVFEAFGNAKTMRNDNSSRFGKFTQLQFDVQRKTKQQQIPLCLLAGSRCTTYLLEKSRVVSHSEGERTYHIFYQLLAAPDEYKQDLWEGFKGTTADSFRYIGGNYEMNSDETATSATTVTTIDGVTDTEQWPRTLEALKVFTLEGESLRTLMRALCAVLQLGNLTFDYDPTAEYEEGGTVVTNPNELEKLSILLGISAAEIEAAMTLRVIKTGYDEVNVQLRPSVARDSCDALAKEIYARVFDFLVRKINDYTEAHQHYRGKKQFGMISLLDIFGFEKFENNRFEQLCINYANEKLQYKYVFDNFLQLQEEYLSEGIDLFDFDLVDNSQVLDLFEGKIGLIVSLNEECVRPNGNDESYVYKVKMCHKEHKRLIDEKLHDKTKFGVNHFAGPVTYDATKFVERNTDKLPEDLLNCARKSNNELIRSEFEKLVAAQEKDTSSSVVHKKKTNRTVLERFRSQLKDLMGKMDNTKTRYIRCIKPNETMTPKIIDHEITMHQLLCAGLVTAITISRESFPNKISYEATKKRFGILVHVDDRKNIVGANLKDAVNYILSYLLFTMADDHRDGTFTWPFACGKTHVYFRSGALEYIETQRMDYYNKYVVKVQQWVRKTQEKTKYQALRAHVITVQAIVRGKIERMLFQRLTLAAIVLQCWIRCGCAQVTTNRIRTNRAAILLQATWRSTVVPKHSNLRVAAIVIQRGVRNHMKRRNASAQLAIAIEEARMNHKLIDLKKEVSRMSTLPSEPLFPNSDREEKGAGKEDNEKVLTEIKDMFGYLQNEIYTLRGENSAVRTELEESEHDKRVIMAAAESAESAVSGSKLSVSVLTKENVHLSNEALKQKEESSNMRKQMKELETVQKAKCVSIQVECESKLAERETELIHMVRSVKRERGDHEYEKETLRAEVAKLQERHTIDVLGVKDELRRSQDSHHEYLAKLMDVLETSHTARESESARISKELTTVKEEKDAEIMKLQYTIEMLREMNQGSVASLETTLQSRNGEISSMRRNLENNADARSQRARRFAQVASRLEAAVTSDARVSPKADGKRRPSKTEMVRFLKELYAVEENSQAEANENTLQMLDEYVVASEPNQAVEILQGKFQKLEFENTKLTRDLEDRMVCKRCERRDERRREQQDSGKLQRSSKRSTGRAGKPPPFR